MATFPARFVNLEQARARFGDRVDRLGAFLSRVDPLADAVVVDIEGMRDGFRLFEAAARDGIASVPRAPDSFHALFTSVERTPFWVDWDILDRGGEVLLRAGVLGGLVLGLKSLVLGYTSPAGNKPLVFSGRLQEHASRRVNETAKFVHATIMPGSMHPHREGWQITLKVRLMHARVRRMILGTGRWDPAWGAPINQHDMLGTSLLFSIAVLSGLRTLGVRIPIEAADAYMHLWRWSGWLSGLDPELLVTAESEGDRIVELISATQAEPDDDSRALTRALLDAPLRMAKTDRALAKAQRLFRFSTEVCRELIGDPRADALSLPRTNWRYSVPLMRRLVSSVELVRERVPFGDVPAVWAGSRYWDRVIAVGLAGATAEFALPDRLSRAAAA
jgi:hypothetical protein